MPRIDDKILLRRYHEDGDLQAREKLIEQYMSLVRSLARRYSYRGEQLEDLVQIGAIGLIKAIDRFDLERGVELTTYATPNIIGEIKRHFRDKGWSVRVPRGLQELNVQLSRLVEQLTVQLGRSPTIPELAKAAGVEEEEVLEALESGRAYSSLSLSVGGGGGDDDDLDPLESIGTEEHQYEVSEDRAVLAPGFKASRRARAEDPAAPLLRRADAVADRAAGRDLADARLPPDPPLAREDPRDDRRGRRVARPLGVRREDAGPGEGRASLRRLSTSWKRPTSVVSRAACSGASDARRRAIASGTLSMATTVQSCASNATDSLPSPQPRSTATLARSRGSGLGRNATASTNSGRRGRPSMAS